MLHLRNLSGNLKTLRGDIVGLGQGFNSLFPEQSLFGDLAGAEAHTFIASSAREMLNKAENEASGMVSTALSNLALYGDRSADYEYCSLGVTGHH